MAGESQIKVIKVGGKSYAVGLFWQPVQDEKNFMKEVREAVRSVLPAANLVCTRRGSAPQYGLGMTLSRQKAGMPAGAAAVANALRDKSSAVAVLKVDEGWWFITIRNNLILAEEDVVYEKEAAARDAFVSMLSIPDWGYRIAPASWDIEDTVELAAGALLAKGAGGTELKTIRGEVNVRLLLGLALAAGVGLAWWQRHDAEQRRKQLEYEEILAEAQEAEEEEDPSLAHIPAPYENLMDPLDFAKKCTILVSNTFHPLPGWSLVQATCTEREMAASFRRTYGTAGWIFDAKDFGRLPGEMELKATDSSYNSILGSIAIPMVRRAAVPPLYDKPTIQKRMSDVFQSLRIDNFRFEDKTETRSNPRDPQDKKSFSYTLFTFTDVMWRQPIYWVNVLAEMKSVEISTIKWDNTNKKWTYEGKIYEKTE